MALPQKGWKIPLDGARGFFPARGTFKLEQLDSLLGYKKVFMKLPRPYAFGQPRQRKKTTLQPFEPDPCEDTDYLARFDAMSFAAARAVITSYSTSFAMSTKLLGARVRTDICNLYAVVRIADEIVDGTAKAAGGAADAIAGALDDYERLIIEAPSRRFHTDPIVHAYAITARRCHFEEAHVRAFFTSMRGDLTQRSYDARDFDDYIYGSAEVIGLLCVAIFVAGEDLDPATRASLDEGARALGAAFQKVNFLRDISEDTTVLGRTYFPALSGRVLDDAIKAELIADIRNDLAVANAVIPLLPDDARRGVRAAADLFSELTDRIDQRPAREVLTARVSVPAARKLLLLAKAARC